MVEWDFLFNTLDTFNFGPVFINWIKLLYHNISSYTTNNGFLSRNFKLTRGIRQGCPISALLFVLVAEILSIKLRTDETVTGIQVNGTEYKICQLADDTTIFVKNLQSLKNAINLFQRFQEYSGLKLNLEKCEIIPLGPCRESQLKLPKDVDKLTVNIGAFKTLGIWFSYDFDESVKLNYEERFNKIKTVMQIWKQRSLSWKGRIMIIKTLILSQVTHLLSMIFTPLHIIKKLDNILFHFLWGDSPPRIKRETIVADTNDGGLKMTDVFSFHNAQKAMWVKRYLQNTNGKWKMLFQYLCNIKKYKFDHKLSSNDFTCQGKFHHQVLDCWFTFKSSPPNTLTGILNEFIFLKQIY